MALKSVTWILIISCLAALAVSAPTSKEDASEDATTIAAVTVPGVLSHEKKTKRETEKQDADRREGEKSERPLDDWKKPTESADTKPSEATRRLARGTDEQKSESTSPSPSADTSDEKKDESKHRQKREAEQKKDETKKPTSTENKSDAKRPQRDVAGVGQPRKDAASQPTPSPEVKKEEKHN